MLGLHKRAGNHNQRISIVANRPKSAERGVEFDLELHGDVQLRFLVKSSVSLSAAMESAPLNLQLLVASLLVDNSVS